MFNVIFLFCYLFWEHNRESFTTFPFYFGGGKKGKEKKEEKQTNKQIKKPHQTCLCGMQWIDALQNWVH